MIIDSPIVSGSFLSTGSLSQIGNAQITGSLTVSGSSISLVNGAFSGSGANLFGIPATGITGLNLSQISSGSVSASISPNLGLLINTSVSASNFTGSFTGSLTGIATSASYAAFALTSSYSLGGSGFPFSGSAVITGSLLVSGSQVITGSLAISTLSTGSGVRYVIADANGLISAQTASAAIFTTQQAIATSGQTVFPITNGYSTGYVTVFVNGTKLNASEYTDTSGTNIVLATGSMVNDVVEFQKYLPASGVSNNALRTVNYFTASLGQTLFNVNYTPGLLDVFYNGSKLDNTEYTAANGTSITLATASNAGDTIEVDVYSYQVGAFSGIGGTGVANQLAYYNTSNSITGSNNFVVSGSAIIITGSLIVSGSGTLINIGPAIFSGSVSSTAGFTGSFSGTATSASYATTASYALTLGDNGAAGFVTTASYNPTSASFSSRTTQIENVYATTGSNSFRATQSITGSLTVTGQIIAQTINVQQVTSSIVYSSGSNVFGCDINSRQTFTGSFYQTGSLAYFSNCVGIGTITTSGRLDVQASGLSTFSYFFRNSSGGYGGGVYNTGACNTQLYLANSASVENVLISSSGSSFFNGGNIGVGTNTPTLAKLQVNSGGNEVLGFFGAGQMTAGQQAFLQVGKNQTCLNNAGELSFRYCADDSDCNMVSLGFYGNGQKLNVVKSGNVGIGTAAPNKPLDVRGDAVFYACNTAFSEGISVFANIGSTSGAGINFHCGCTGVLGSVSTLKSYIRLNQTGACLMFATYTCSTDLISLVIDVPTGNAKFNCALTAKTIGTNDLILNNLNYECANYVDGTRGSWLIQEGACDLFIINQMSCKKYKFNLIEIK